MPRFWFVPALFALALIALTAGKALAADPPPEAFIEVLTESGHVCTEGDTESGAVEWNCQLEGDDLYLFAHVLLGESFGQPYLSIGSDFSAADSGSSVPIRPEAIDLWHQLIDVAVGDDTQAHEWLDGVTADRSVAADSQSDEHSTGDWTFHWQTYCDTDLCSRFAALTLSHSPDGGSGGASSGDAWSSLGKSTYEGFWTYSSPGFPGEPEPGTLEVDCTVATGGCSLTGTVADGLSLSAGDAPAVGEGLLRRTETNEVTLCGLPAEETRSIDVQFGPESATVVEETLYEPWTCETYDGELYSMDLTTTFEGTLIEYVPSPEGGESDLAGYLTSLGLSCDQAVGQVETCDLQLADSRYEVITTRDAQGEVVAVEASVTSFDASMPSDAGGFLKGVAERTPVVDHVGLAAWFDEAIAGGESRFTSGPWSAVWTDTPTDGGTVWALRIEQSGASESVAPLPTDDPAPAAPLEPGASEPGAEAFSRSVPPPAEVSTDPIVLLQSAGLAALLVFLMPFPSQLFNSTLESHEDEIRRWLRLDRIGSVVGDIGAFWASWPGVILFTVLAGLLYGFLDPGFGIDLGSLATFLGMLLGIVLVTMAFAIPSVLAHRRHGDTPSLKVVPVSLLIGVACVLLSRLTNFQPGYLYGLLIGLAFARELSAAEEGRATAVGAVAMLATALVAWLGLGALPDGDGFALAVGRTALAALLVAGLEGVVFGLLPMRFLPGEPLYAWNRILWGSLLAVGAFAFFHILINPASGYLSDSSRTPLFTVLALLISFSAVSVAFWAWFRFRGGAPADEQTTA